jgi:hypothetical protein
MYFLQLVTKNFGLQLNTEVLAGSIAELQAESRANVERCPAMVGETYRIWEMTKNELGYLVSKKLLKEGTIEGGC